MTPRTQIHQRTKSREESRIENRQMAVAMHEGMHPIELALRAGALQPKIGEQVRPHPASDEVQRVVTRDHTQQRDDQSDRIARDALVRQETAHEQRDILGHRQAPPAQHQDHEQSQVGEVFDVRGNETDQQSLSVGEPVPQRVANFVDWRPAIHS